MRVLWRCYDFACKACGAFLYECRVPGDRNVTDYCPEWCHKCGSIQISTREKGAPRCA